MKFLRIVLFSLLGLVSLLLTLVVILYFNLGLLINTDRLDYVLNKFDVFKSYEWKDGIISWENRGISSKELLISFKDFCFHYQKESTEAKGCFEVIHFNALVSLTPPFISYLSDFTLESSQMDVIVKESEKKEETPPQEIDINKYYSYLWSSYVPGLDFKFKNISADISNKRIKFPLNVIKNSKAMSIQSGDYEILATDRGVQFHTLSDIFVPVKDEKVKISRTILNLSMGEIIRTKLYSEVEFAQISVSTALPSVLWTNKIPTFVSYILNQLKLSVFIPQISSNMEKRVKAPYNKLPAPFHSMEGDIAFKWEFTPKSEFISEGKGELKIDLQGNKQFFNMSILPKVDISAEDFSYRNLNVEILFNKVFLELPRISKKSLPPQFTPDSRFKSNKKPVEKKESDFKLNLDVLAKEENSLHLKTDLLDEEMRLNFHFLIEENEMKKGYVRLLPLKTTILKRPIRVENLLISFPKGKLPELNSEIWFDLPEYKVKLLMEGPLSSPRYLFTSYPPLPQSDIYSVLLFGRPLADMGGDNTTAAQQTSQLLSQGLLSLSVLYILSGTPIEYIGYDSQSKQATAQVGLGDKNSLRVSSGQSGRRSTGIRRSLGRGWYLDTSVQTPNNSSTDNRGARDYGVFLERIISY